MVRVFLRTPSGITSLVCFVIIVIAALTAGPVFGHAANTDNVTASLQPPSPQHWLGTDELGRDLLARVVAATPLTLGLALGAVVLGALIGIPLGALVGTVNARVRTVLLRGIDLMLAFPAIILAIYLCVVIGPGPLGPIVGVGIATSFSFARLTSALTLSIVGREFVQAARVVGVRGPKLVLRHIVPNVADSLIATTTFHISGAIVAISGLSFLGLGVALPSYDWGSLLTSGIEILAVNPLAALGPAVAIAFTAVAFGFLGEALARANNPLLDATGRRRLRLHQTTAEPALELDAASVGDRTRPSGGTSVCEPLTLEVASLNVRFPSAAGDVHVVRDVSLTMRRGERLGIVGESGSGKTMTAMALAQLVSHPGRVSGSIRLDGVELVEPDARRIPADRGRFLSQRMAVVFQDPMSSLNPAMTIGAQLAEAVRPDGQVSRSDAMRRSAQRLAEVGIPDAERQVHRYPHEFSGGMRQRALIAMGLMNRVQLLIADEPTTALDVTIQAQIMDLLENVGRTHGSGVILISHNLGLIRQNTDRVLVMYAGHIVEEIRADGLDSPRHPYTKALLSAVPDMSRSRSERLTTIAGQAPDPAARPTGCSFHPRCPLVTPRCREEQPPMVRRSPDSRVACWVANQDVAA